MFFLFVNLLVAKYVVLNGFDDNLTDIESIAMYYLILHLMRLIVLVIVLWSFLNMTP